MIDSISTNGIKIPQKSYLKEGSFPIVDQGQGLIGGFTDDESKVLRNSGEVVVFGDHTRCFKLINFDFAPGADGVKILKPGNNLDCRFIYYALTALKLPNRGYSRHYSFLRKSKIPLPPLNEQKRIVEKIEELFSEIDKGVESLKTAREQLNLYRQAILKHAFEGKLTADWREGFQISPDSWGIVRVKDVAVVGTGATPKRGQKKYYENGTHPWITSGALNSEFVTEHSELITDAALKETNCKLYKPGTILVAMYGEGKTRGKSAVLKIEAATNQACAAITIKSENVLRDYLWSYFKYNYENIRLQSSGGVQPNLNLTHIKNIRVPLPSLAEQRVIVEEVDRQISKVKKTQMEIDLSLLRLNKLRQSILKKAFSGKLVAQDPNDEPASVLLDRIQTEKEKNSKKKKGKAA
nr:restriction endonuclease subunit S [Parahaliea mediterranea]